ncbi:MAG: hypothetical protein ACYC0Q_10820 [Eubacteriales bacterium]
MLHGGLHHKVVALRLGMGISAWIIPLSFGAAVAGQMAGGRSCARRSQEFRR